MTTHFHMLVRSPIGELSDAMRRIQNVYARYFNRSRRRDGPTMRGRFRSKPVESLGYRRVLVRYIDANPVQAGLCADPSRYPWGSARQYVHGTGPRWLSREWVESEVAERSGMPRFDPNAYACVFDARRTELIASLVECRIDAPGTRDELDSLLRMASPEALAWLRRKARLADGGTSEQPYASPGAIAEAIARLSASRGAWAIPSRGRTIDGWQVLHAGLLRDLACASHAAVAMRLGVSPEQARRLASRHRHLLGTDEHYGAVAANTMIALVSTEPGQTHTYSAR